MSGCSQTRRPFSLSSRRRRRRRISAGVTLDYGLEESQRERKESRDACFQSRDEEIARERESEEGVNGRKEERMMESGSVGCG